MPAPVDSLLVGIVDHAVAALKLMGRERGYRRNYSEVTRVLIPWFAEPDYGTPTVQVQLRDSEEDAEEVMARWRNRDQLVIQVHLKPEEASDGSLDITTAQANVRADIFQALMAERHRGLGTADTHRLRSESPAIGDEELIGATVREIYLLSWDHDPSGMHLEPGG